MLTPEFCKEKNGAFVELIELLLMISTFQDEIEINNRDSVTNYVFSFCSVYDTYIQGEHIE